MISGILYVLKVGCRWPDCPAEYGPPTTIYNRFHRRAQRGRWQRLFAKVAASGAVPAAHPDRRSTLWFVDEARVGQKGRIGRRRWLRGERPRGLCGPRFDRACIHAAVRPATGQDACLVLPEVSAAAMTTFLEAIVGAS